MRRCEDGPPTSSTACRKRPSVTCATTPGCEWSDGSAANTAAPTGGPSDDATPSRAGGPWTANRPCSTPSGTGHPLPLPGQHPHAMDTHGTGPGLTSDTTQWRAGCGANSHARFGGRPAETDPPKDGHRAAGRPHLAGDRARSVPAPGPAGDPRPPRPQGRPALRHPTSPACRRRTPHRPPARPPRPRPGRGRTPRRGRRRLAVRPAGPRGLPRTHPRGRTRPGREGHRRVPLLPDPRDPSARPDPEAVARGVPGLLRHRRRE